MPTRSACWVQQNVSRSSAGAVESCMRTVCVACMHCVSAQAHLWMDTRSYFACCWARPEATLQCNVPDHACSGLRNGTCCCPPRNAWREGGLAAKLVWVHFQPLAPPPRRPLPRHRAALMSTLNNWVGARICHCSENQSFREGTSFPPANSRCPILPQIPSEYGQATP